MTVFDRAAKRLGFAAADEAVCGAVSGPGAAPVDARIAVQLIWNFEFHQKLSFFAEMFTEFAGTMGNHR